MTSLEQYRNSLIKEILEALSNDEIRRHCDAAVQALSENRLNEHLITRFIDKTIIVLDHHKTLLHLPAEQQRCSTAQLRLYGLRQLRQQKYYN